MSKIITLLAFVFLAMPAEGLTQEIRLADLVDGVERKLRNLRDLSADFVQIHEDPLNRTYREEGHLYLKRPRMMRWEYRTPEEKLFVTDGTMVYLYVPDERQVNRERVDESFDDRIPLMFLLGRSDLQGEFSRIERLGVEPQVAGSQVLRMEPRRQSDIQEVLLEVDPATFDIRRLRLSYQDASVADFIFGAIRTNTNLAEGMFRFEAPPGVDVIEGIGQ